MRAKEPPAMMKNDKAKAQHRPISSETVARKALLSD
jgi:hypothetical protein